MSSLIAPGPAPCCGAVRHVLALNNAAHLPRAVIERRRSALRALIRMLAADLAVDALFFESGLCDQAGMPAQHLPSSVPSTDIVIAGELGVIESESIRVAITREAQVRSDKSCIVESAFSADIGDTEHCGCSPSSEPTRGRPKKKVGSEQACRACTVAKVDAPMSGLSARASMQALGWAVDRSLSASCWIDLPDAGASHALIVLRRPGKAPFSVRDRETLGMAHEALLWLVREAAEERLNAYVSQQPVHLHPTHMTTGGVPTSAGQSTSGAGSNGQAGAVTSRPVVRVTDFARSNTPSRINAPSGGASGLAAGHARVSRRTSNPTGSAAEHTPGPHAGRGDARSNDADRGAERPKARPMYGSVRASEFPRDPAPKQIQHSPRPSADLLSVGFDHPLARGLTRQQRAVLPLLLEGQPEADIAKAMHRSVHTIHDHAKAIYAKLGVSTRAQLVARFMMSA